MNSRPIVAPLAVIPGRTWRFTVATAFGTDAPRRSAMSPSGGRPGIDPDRARVSVVSVQDFRHRATVSMERDESGRDVFSFAPEISGEYLVWIYARGGEWPAPPSHRGSFFAAAPCHAAMVPWKGDLHMHTTRSDGAEEPAELLARMRFLGMDYVAVTDHRRHDPSVESAREAARLGHGLVVVPGEEVNLCQGPGHIVALGTTAPVTDRLPVSRFTHDRNYLDSFANLDEMMDRIVGAAARAGDGDPILVSYCREIVRRIHDAGGVAVLAHPMWSSHGAMDLIRTTLDRAVSERLFDAIEVFGGMTMEENMRSYAYYASRLGESDVPVVGSSDTHGPARDHAGRLFTVAFCRDLTPGAVVDAIRSRRTVACAAVAPGRRSADAGPADGAEPGGIQEPGGAHAPREAQAYLTAGQSELSEYTHFVLREFFPEHDRLCRAIVGGDAEAKEALSRLYRDAFPSAYSERMTSG